MEKRKLLSMITLCMLLVTVFGVRSGFTAARVIPMEEFFCNPESTAFQLSPDGKQIAFLKPYEQRLNIFIQEVGQQEKRRITTVRDQDIQFFCWKDKETMIYLQDSDGDENFHIYSVNITTGQTQDVTPFPGVRAGIVDALADREQEMLIFMNRENPRVFDVYRLNLSRGTVTLEIENPGNFTSYMTDHHGVVRIACGKDPKTGANLVYYRKDSQQPFQMVRESEYEDTFRPCFFAADNQKIYGISNIGRDKKALVLTDLETNIPEEVIYVHPQVDVRGVAISAKRKVLLGVSYVTDKVHICFLDEQERLLHQGLRQKLGDYELSIVSEDRQEKRCILMAHNDRNPGEYYLYDVRTDRLEKLTSSSNIREDELASVKPIQYTGRDGTIIHGYLTVPQGRDGQKLPLIVYPHGGPWSRDIWEYQPDVQFLANRGYAVLQMNFRGSTGYGKAFLNGGNKEWGKKMQDDITDGVQWAIEQGVADPEKIGIYGSSYGGYAVLAGLAFTPERYACGVDLCGPSNLFTLLASLPPYWKPSIIEFYERVGHPQEDARCLREASPLFYADKIKVPLLVGQGKNDPRVTIKESNQMIEALRQRGLAVTYLVKNNEGHGFRKEENRLDFYREMESFLEKYLKNG